MEGITLAYNSPFVEAVHMYDITPEDVHIDAPISNILLNYRPQNYIADQILPVVPVNKQSDLVPGIKIDDRFRTEETIRAPGTEPRMIHFHVTSQQYFAVNRALGTYATAEELANADTAWNTRQIRAELIYDILLLDHEIRVANLVTSGSNVGSYWTTGSSWTDWDNSAPLDNVLNDIEVTEQLRGYRPSKIVFGKTAWFNFRNSDQVVARLFPHGGAMAGGNRGALVNKPLAAELLEVEQVLVGGAYYNSAAEDATLALTRIWHDSVLYYWNPARPSKERPAFGYSFRWNVAGMPNTPLQGGGENAPPAPIVKTFPFDDKKGRQDMHVGYYQDEKILDKYLACLRTGVGSSQ